jgi:tRNA (cmo5U34)-methyltransferase
MSNPESESSYDLTKKFSFDSIEGFDEHISLHIRDYDRLRATVLAIADSFIIGGKRVYDMGCSTGKLITALDTKYADRRAEYVGIDVNHNFAKDFEDTDTVKFNKADVTRGYSFSEASLILSLFTLQFIDPKDRLRVLDSISESLDIGYGFIVAEKVYPDSANAFRILEGGSNDHKLAHTSADEVIKKERDIRDIMRPFEEELLVAELKKRFRSTTTIWSCFNFRAWLCIK